LITLKIYFLEDQSLAQMIELNSHTRVNDATMLKRTCARGI